MITIETRRLLIRNFGSDDADSLREMIVQKESSPYAVYDHEWPTSENEIKGIVAWFASQDHYLAVGLKETGKLIGFISLNPAGSEESIEFDIGYCLNSDYHNHGYATEGCQAVIDFAFQELKAASLTSGTAAHNGPSCRLLNRLGLKKISEGTTSFRKTPEGKPIEFVGWGFALSKEDWLDSQAEPGCKK